MNRHLTAALILAAPLAAVAPIAAQTAPARQSAEGRIHGTITSRAGNSYTGIIRWGREEAFWDDLFNSSKDDLDHARHVPADARRRGREIKVFGFTIGYHWDESHHSRQFIARYGDILWMEPRGGERVAVHMKSGTTHLVDGGSNDIGATLHVEDAALGEIEVRWRDVARIEFSPVPAATRPEAWRLHGEVETEAGRFAGFIQWDSEECLSTDRLDGETPDGDVSLPMGTVRAIEKRDRRGSWVETVDGRRLLLEGTNDVDHSLRGIFVEDPRFGRVKVGWSSFERLELRPVATSGRGYGDYPASRPLQGTVTDQTGRRHRGRLIYDLDEAETWELLNGNTYDVEFYIPFDRIASVEPRTSRSSLVTLRDGRKIHLEKGTDVGESHAGMLIFPTSGGEPVYVAWSEVRRVDFE